MTSRKNQNSILFLTTLGVYLGLVLVGATPQVLAQAATTKQFSLKDEIEVKDDLDDKPDGCRVADKGRYIRELESVYLWFNYKSVGEHTSLIERFLDSYSDVPAFDVTWKAVGEFRPMRSVVASASSIGAGRSSDGVNEDVIFVGNGLPGKTFEFTAARDASGYSFRFVSQGFAYDPPLVRQLYGSAYEFERCLYNTEREEVILRHTDIKVEGANLVITTHLPRGSLDSLLATDAK